VDQLESFQIDDVRFICDIRAGADRSKSKDGEFILVKEQEFLRFYRGLQQHHPSNILEIGMFEGGSLVLFDKLYEPEKLVGIDIRRQPIEPLERYREGREHIVTMYGLSQDDPKLTSILRKEFPNGIDLIVDDASHQYGLSGATFHLCFPFLKPGGLYVIEDWSWSHKPPYQTPAHPWFEKPALTNLVMELVINMPGSEQMERVTVHRDLVVVEKAETATGAIDLADGHDHLRGRELLGHL
jgi:predicted O-methyltransferase YrrM